jgi:hypothetical protein
MTTVTIFEVVDTADGEVLRVTHSSDRAHAWLFNERKESSLDMSVRTRVLEDVDPKHAALARHLDESPESVSECRYGDDMFECDGVPGEYRVLTDSERDSAARESLLSHIDDCREIPDAIRPYFDEDRWIRDALLSDGYGHTLSGYDGEEHEEQIDGEWYYIYRTN